MQCQFLLLAKVLTRNRFYCIVQWSHVHTGALHNVQRSDHADLACNWHPQCVQPIWSVTVTAI